MEQSTASGWKRRGSSVVWLPELLGPLITDGEVIPLRTALGWLQHGFPAATPGDAQTVLVGGLQTVLDVLPDPNTQYGWLRQNILPLVQAFGHKWQRVGLVFGMDGPGRLFSLKESDDLVYFGRGSDWDKKVKLSLAIWNGAATGSGACQLIVEETKAIGGYHVQRVS